MSSSFRVSREAPSDEWRISLAVEINVPANSRKSTTVLAMLRAELGSIITAADPLENILHRD
jgi:hypothetical protein